MQPLRSRIRKDFAELIRTDPADALRLLAELQAMLQQQGGGGAAYDTWRLPVASAGHSTSWQPIVSHEEQVAWAESCTKGGSLLRIQSCAATEVKDLPQECLFFGEESPAEWFAGRLFIAEAGVLFKSDDEAGLNSGLLRWDSIRLRKSAHEAKVMLAFGAAPAEQALQLELGAGEAEWLLGAWRRQGAQAGPSASAEPPRAGTAALPPAAARSVRSLGEQVAALPDSACLSWTTLRASFVCGQLPTGDALEGKLVTEDRLPDLTLDTVRALFLEADCPLHRLLKEELSCEDLRSTPWCESQRVLGSRVRRSRFLMPVKGVPDWVNKFLPAPFPKAARVTALYRLRSNDAELVVVQQAYSEGVPFGECMRHDAVMVFQPHPHGGIQFRQYFEVVWVQNLPWALRWLRSMIDTEAAGQAANSGHALLKVLQHRPREG